MACAHRVAMSFLGPIASTWWWYMQFPTGLANGNCGHTVFRRECGQGLIPNILIKLVAIPELQCKGGSSHYLLLSSKIRSVLLRVDMADPLSAANLCSTARTEGRSSLRKRCARSMTLATVLLHPTLYRPERRFRPASL